MNRKLLLQLFALVACLLCSMSAAAAEAYACYTMSDSTLTFYFDNVRSSRSGTTYDLNDASHYPGWYSDGTYANVTEVYFHTSFKNARPTSTRAWFRNMTNLTTMYHLSYLNTENVTTMWAMFEGCSGMTFLDVYEFNTANVTIMTDMFKGCSGLTSLDVRSFNTANVMAMPSMFYGCSGLTSLDLSNFNTSKVISMNFMFSGCTNLKTIYAGTGWTTDAVTQSTNMFSNCTKLVGGKGTTYSSSHIDATYAHIDGGTSNPGYFTEKKEAYACYTPSNTTLTFYYDSQRYSRTGTTYNLNADDINPGWRSDGTNTSVTRVVFDPSFAVARPTTTYRWFNNMTGLTTISGLHYLNTSEVTNMQNMFSGSGLTSLDLSGFNTANVTDMSYMFYNCSNLRSLDVSSFNTSNVTDMRTMFYGCSNLTSLDVSSFNTSSATTLTYMFCGCSSLTSLDVSCFNTSSAKNLSYMFRDCSGLTSLDLGSFNTSRATNMSYMFDGCSGLNTIYAGDGWNTAAVTSSANMFWNCSNIKGGKGTTYDANHIDKAYAHIDGGPSNPGYFTEKPKEAYACYTSDNTTLTFYYDNQRSSRSGTTYDLNTGYDWPGWRDDGSNASVTRVVFDSSFAGARPTSTHLWFGDMVQLTTITGMKQYLSGFNTAQVTSMLNMFSNCRSLTSLDLSNFNTAQVTSMSYMFYGCSGLTNLDLSSFNTAKVTSMYSMFCGCSSLTSLDLSSFNPAQLVNTRYMFQDCSDLATIYAGSGWSTATVTYSGDMFLNCTSLVGGMGTTYNSSHVDATYAHIDGGPSNPGYFTEGGAHGDVNGDGAVNITDVTALIDLLLSGAVPPAAADCNRDGNVNITDVTALIDYLLSGSW